MKHKRRLYLARAECWFCGESFVSATTAPDLKRVECPHCHMQMGLRDRLFCVLTREDLQRLLKEIDHVEC